MTAILGLFASDGHPTDDATVSQMLARMGSRGGARASVWREGGVVLAVSRHEWEFGAGFSGPALVVQDGDHVIAADASLYYRNDLRRKLAARDVKPKGETPSHLILAAYEAFGDKCAEILEGDFSFIIWDRKARRVFCSRDHSGLRPLFYSELASTLVVASTIGAVVQHPQCTAELNLSAIAVDAGALLFSRSLETCYQGVLSCQAGSSLSRLHDRSLELARWWDPTRQEPRHPTPLEEAADELLEVLGAAVDQRLDRDAPTSLWLSGGWDSTAVFAAGQRALTQRGERDRFRLISVSYPPGDSGREDERIAPIGAMWNTPIKWIDIADVPLFDPAAQQGVVHRDEPYVHAYEQWLRTMARASRDVGSRVALNGHGGDFLFQVSPVYLADLLSRGRLLALVRDLRSMRQKGGNARRFLQWAVQPLLSDRSHKVLARIRGRYAQGPFERSLPLWMRTPFADAHGLVQRARAGSPRTNRGSRAAYEAHWYLTEDLFARLNSCTTGYALEEGIEMRAPLYDRRVIDFALSRPIAERNTGGEQKLLLRQAMRDLMPVEVLAPRPIKTGTLAGYFATSMQAAAPLITSVFQSPKLGELGIVNASALQRSAAVYLRGGGDTSLGEQVFATLQTELWLRAELERKTNIATASIQAPTNGSQLKLTGSFA